MGAKLIVGEFGATITLKGLDFREELGCNIVLKIDESIIKIRLVF